MEIDIDKIAKLARLKLDEKLKEKLKKEIPEILKAFEIVEKLEGEIKIHSIDLEGKPREDNPKKKEFNMRLNIEWKEDNYVIGPKVR